MKANIKAQEIIVFGTIKGNVESESRVSLRTGATIVGDIKTAGIVIEDGAYFKGGIDISRGEGVKPAPKSQGASAGQQTANKVTKKSSCGAGNSFAAPCVQRSEAAPSKLRNCDRERERPLEGGRLS